MSTTNTTHADQSATKKTAQSIGSLEFEELKNKGGVYLIDFWAVWCPPCKVMSPIIDEFANEEELSEITFLKVNVDEETSLGGMFGIRSIPTFTLIKFKGDGSFDIENDVISKYVGAIEPLELKKKLLADLEKSKE